MHESEPIPLTPQPTDGGASETEGWWPADPQREDAWQRFNSRQRWAHRLAFPLMALAVVCAWRGVRVSQGDVSVLSDWAWWVLAMVAAIGGMVAVRLRKGHPGTGPTD
jgi:FtsH-binding integral membrane protein